MIRVKLFLLLTLSVISNLGYPSEVIPPGVILMNISQNHSSIKELRSDWVIKSSDLLKNSSEEALLLALTLLQDIDVKSIDDELWENKIQRVKTKKGQNIEIKFRYAKYDYGPNDIALSGIYTLISVKKYKP